MFRHVDPRPFVFCRNFTRRLGITRGIMDAKRGLEGHHQNQWKVLRMGRCPKRVPNCGQDALQQQDSDRFKSSLSRMEANPRLLQARRKTLTPSMKYSRIRGCNGQLTARCLPVVIATSNSILTDNVAGVTRARDCVPRCSRSVLDGQ